MRVSNYAQFGGKHVESANLKNVLAHAGVANPATGRPLSEALCFGIAGGIGAGYSFCPSVVRHGKGSGVSVVGRHRAYATSAAWYEGFFERIGASIRITETAAPGKAFQNLKAELEDDRPAIVWCGRAKLPYLGDALNSAGCLWMHSFIVYAVDEAKDEALGADRAPTPVSLTLEELSAARNSVCSHKNRTLTFEPPADLTETTLRTAIRAGIRACAAELLEPRIKTFGLPGLQAWTKVLTNTKSKEGWTVVFKDGLLYCALRDVFDTIETAGTGGSLHRCMYADFLDEAAVHTKHRALSDLAADYRDLGRRWTELAEAALPGKIKPFKQTRDLLTKKCKLFEEKGTGAARQCADAAAKLQELEKATRTDFPLSTTEAADLLADLRDRITDLHAAEHATAQKLQAAGREK